MNSGELLRLPKSPVPPTRLWQRPIPIDYTPASPTVTDKKTHIGKDVESSSSPMRAIIMECFAKSGNSDGPQAGAEERARGMILQQNLRATTVQESLRAQRVQLQHQLDVAALREGLLASRLAEAVARRRVSAEDQVHLDRGIARSYSASELRRMIQEAHEGAEKSRREAAAERAELSALQEEVSRASSDRDSLAMCLAKAAAARAADTWTATSWSKAVVREARSGSVLSSPRRGSGLVGSNPDSGEGAGRSRSSLPLMGSRGWEGEGCLWGGNPEGNEGSCGRRPGLAPGPGPGQWGAGVHAERSWEEAGVGSVGVDMTGCVERWKREDQGWRSAEVEAGNAWRGREEEPVTREEEEHGRRRMEEERAMKGEEEEGRRRRRRRREKERARREEEERVAREEEQRRARDEAREWARAKREKEWSAKEEEKRWEKEETERRVGARKDEEERKAWGAERERSDEKRRDQDEMIKRAIEDDEERAVQRMQRREEKERMKKGKQRRKEGKEKKRPTTPTLDQTWFDAPDDTYVKDPVISQGLPEIEGDANELEGEEETGMRRLGSGKRNSTGSPVHRHYAMVALSSKLALIDGGGVQAMALGFKGAVKEWEKKRVLSDESVQGNSAPISPGTQNAAEPKAAYASSPEEGSPEGGSQEGAPEVHFLQSLNLDNAPPKAPLDTPLDTPVLTAHHAPHHLQAPALDHQQPKSGRPGSFSNVSPPKFSQQSVADLVDLLASEVLETAREAAIELDKIVKTKEGKSAVFDTPLAISRLLALLPTANKGAARGGARVLASLSMDSSGRAIISEECRCLGQQSAESLASLLVCSDIETVQCASLVLGNLVLDPSGRRLLLDCPSVLPSVRELLWSTDQKTLRYIAGVLRNISFHISGTVLLSDSQLIQRLQELLLTCQDDNTVRYASAALKNLHVPLGTKGKSPRLNPKHKAEGEEAAGMHHLV